MNKRKLIPFNWNVDESRGVILGLVLAVALFGFELFNVETNRYALLDLLGTVSIWGLQWALILAIAFGSIDLIGLIRLFMPEQSWHEPKELWLLAGAWFLGASMNTGLTWYALSLAMSRQPVGGTILPRESVLLYAPIMIALLLLLLRILFIGTIAKTVDRLIHPAGYASNYSYNQRSLGLPQGRPRRAHHYRQSAGSSSAYSAHDNGGVMVEENFLD
jgi:hypothetical protein